MLRAALVGVAGAAGALARYGIASAIGGRGFPWATLLINTTGSGALGAILGSGRWSDTTTAVITVGFLGAFTTFSTFAFETTALLRDDRPVAALLYVGASVALGLGAAAIGYAVAREG